MYVRFKIPHGFQIKTKRDAEVFLESVLCDGMVAIRDAYNR